MKPAERPDPGKAHNSSLHREKHGVFYQAKVSESSSEGTWSPRAVSATITTTIGLTRLALTAYARPIISPPTIDRVSHWPRHPKPRLPQKLKRPAPESALPAHWERHSLPGCFQRQNQVRRKDSRMKRRHRHIKPRQSQRQKSRRIPDQP